MAEQRHPGKQKILMQTHEPKSSKVGSHHQIHQCLVLSLPAPYSLPLSIPQAAILSVVSGGLLSLMYPFWCRLLWWFQNLPLPKLCTGIANLHANLDMAFFSISNTGLPINHGHAYRTLKVSIRKKKNQPKSKPKPEGAFIHFACGRPWHKYLRW